MSVSRSPSRAGPDGKLDRSPAVRWRVAGAAEELRATRNVKVNIPQPAPCYRRKSGRELLLVGRFQCRQLAVDNPADRQKLRAVEVARERITAVVVDPVVDAH